MTATLPTGPKDRSIIVDILRGFALTGVLWANFTSYVDQQTPEPVLHAISSPWDHLLMRINTVFFEWKFMTLFSILFGYGFGLILESLEKKQIKPDSFFVKRMCGLFAFGVIHCLFWWGDVLNLYAMSGILLLLFRKRSNRTVLSCSMFFMFVAPEFISYLLRNRPDTFTTTDMSELYQQYKGGSLWTVMKFNIDFYYRMFVVSGSNYRDITETLGRFLFGYFLLRMKFFDLTITKKATFQKVAWVATPIMVVYFVLRGMLLKNQIPFNQYIASGFLKIGILATTTFYVSMLVLAYLYFGMNKFFAALQALGRMTLTNYLMISAFLVVLLYGFGFNQLGELPIHIIWLLAFLWLFAEIGFSTYWLTHFRYGPAEWIWRQLTYGKRLPLRK